MNYTQREILGWGLITIPLVYFFFLLFQHYHGGVPSHHFLADATKPEISNWYGLIVLSILSLLTWKQKSKKVIGKSEVLEFIFAFLYGLILYFTFIFDQSMITKFLFFGLFFVGIIYPLFKIQIYFGIVLGMTYGFGAVLPAFMIGIIIVLSNIIRMISSKIKGSLFRN